MPKIIVAVTLLLSSAAVQAQTQAPAQAAAAKDAKNGERVVCRSLEEIGSRLAARRVCMTVRQWEEQQRIDRETVEQAQRINNPSNN